MEPGCGAAAGGRHRDGDRALTWCGRAIRRAAAGLSALALAACERGERGLAPAVDVHTVIYNMSEQPQFIDPCFNHTIGGGNVISNCFEGLTRVEPGGGIGPGVAASWEVSADGLTWDFTLRPSARWSDGRPVVAEDFRYAWLRVLEPRHAAAYAVFLYPIAGAEDYNKRVTLDPSAVGIDAVDDHHLRLRLVRPVPYLEELLSFGTFMPVRRDVVEAAALASGFASPELAATRWTLQHETYIGNGAFMMDAYERGHIIEFVPNPEYWDRGSIRLDRVRYLLIDSAQSEYIAYRTGQIDVTYAIPYADLPQIREAMPGHLVSAPYIGIYYVAFNFRRPPFDDVRVRRAFSLAFDRDAIRREVNEGMCYTAHSFVPLGIRDADGVTEFCEVSGPLIPNQDIEEARRLLAEAGYPGGRGFQTRSATGEPIPTEYLYNTSERHKQVAERLQNMWRNALGVDVELVNKEAQVFFSDRDHYNFTFARSAWIGDFSDPMTFLETYLSDSGNNRSGYASERYDALIREAMNTPGRERYFELCHEAERVLFEDAVLAPIWFYTNDFLMNPAIEGALIQPTGGVYFQYADWDREMLRAAGLEGDE